MRFNILSAISLLLAVATAGCADDELMYPGQNDGEAAGASPLRFEVNHFSVSNGDSSSRSAEPSATPEPESDSERKIRDFWLFQFNPDGTRLANPAYYSIPKDGATLDDLCAAAFNNLAKNKPMTIFVVTNTGSPTWADSETNFDTLANVKEQELPSPYPIQAGIDSDNNGVADDIYIPMSGQLDNVTVKDKSLIVVPVTRMYAKVKIQVGFNKPTMNLYYANVKGIPWYCTVGPQSKALADNGEPAAVPFPENTRMISRAFKSDEAVSDAAGNKWLVLYMPENIRGEIDGADKKTSTNIPKDALTVTISSKYKGADYFYTVYPGENTKNNFNVRRNRVYRVNIDVRNVTDQHNPSSNCYVVKPGEKLSFEPYNRDEKGGGYNISTYLNPNDPSKTKTIAYVKIIWQTKDCIGNNSNGDLVHYVADTENPINSKIIIEKTGVEGNALVGAYNSNDDIIWSWHIWVTPNEPDNIANAVIYTTYRWDSNGIYNTEPRIPGYGIMPCNLGALAFRSDDDMFGWVRTQTGTTSWGFPIYENIYTQVYSLAAKTKFPDSQIRTFGMMYQWGRKDPFPPMICSTGTEDANGELDYDNDYCGIHYGNDNITEVKKSDKIDGSELFHSALGAIRYRGVQYSIEHPTVYMTGTNNGGTSLQGGGDWCYPTDNELWGGLDPNALTGLSVGDNINIYDNYGEKSIFDPCPRGWRVPPGDLWMSFTRTGKNPSDFSQDVNYCEPESGHRPGLSMYVQAWGSGPTIYFPMQGTRAINGRFKNVGLCGNYHNATCASDTRVNILHFHRDMSVASNNYKDLMLFKVFETKTDYIVKSTASPIRCVRETK